jgi:hypothetical protein
MKLNARFSDKILKKKLSGKSIDMDILTHEEGMRNKLFIVYGLV